jgi:hypothetical protein
MAEDTDAELSARITQLANNLKKLHLAATMEEAYARAREIIGSAPPPGGEKTIGQLQAELQQAQDQAGKDEAVHDAEHPQEEPTEEIDRELGKAKEEVDEHKRLLELEEKQRQGE